MTSESANLPAAVDRAAFQAELDALRVREKAHTREGDAIAATRRRLPMTEVDASLELTGPDGPVTLLDAFEGRRQLIAYYFMWWPGHPAADQCEGCTWVTTQVSELSYLHSRDITFAVFCQGRNVTYDTPPPHPYDESVRYRDFMGWDVPWYSAHASLDTLLAGREIGLFHLVCYLRDGDRVFETYWTTRRGAEAMDNNYALMDLTVYGRQEPWEDSPPGWPQGHGDYTRMNGRPIAQWPRIEAGRSDDLTRSQTLYTQRGRKRESGVIVVTQSRADALARLDVFAGEWAVVARFSGGDAPAARSTFEWALDRQFLIQRIQVPVPEAPDALTIVSTDPETGAYTQHYYDSRGVVRLYAMTLAGGVWTLTRESPDFTPLDFRQRFTGTFSADQNTISGAWETSPADGGEWKHDFGLTYRRVG